MTRNATNRKKLTTKNSKFKSKNQKIEKKKDCFVKLKVIKNPILMEDVMVESRQRIKLVRTKVQTKVTKVIAKTQDNSKAKDRADRALKREAIEKEMAQVQDREYRAEQRALRIEREWKVKREKEKQLLKEKEDAMIKRAKILSLQKTKEASSKKTKSRHSPIMEEPEPSTEEPSTKESSKDKSETGKSEKELRMEARVKAREEEERKEKEAYWPEWDEMKKTKKKRKRTADRLVFKQSDYNMTDSDESSDEDEDTRYSPARTSEPSNEVPKPAQTDKPTKQIPLWAQGERLEDALEKQSEQSSYDLDSLFFQMEMPDLKLMFPKQKKKFIRRTSSAVWLAPPPASFRVAA